MKDSVTLAMLGARRHYAVPRALHEAGLLRAFVTDFYVGNKPWLTSAFHALPSHFFPRLIHRLFGRHCTAIPPYKVTSFDTLGVWYALCRRLSCSPNATEHLYVEAARRFNQLMLSNITLDEGIFWGFNSASLELFRAARARQLPCILDQTILPKRLELQLLHDEARRWPDWEQSKCFDFHSSQLASREEEEWSLADRIVAGSQFVRTGLLQLGVPEHKINVIPSAFDSSPFQSPHGTQETRGNFDKPLNVLFAGRVCLRKGIPDLLHALDQLSTVRLNVSIAGTITVGSDKLRPWRDRVRFLGPVPRSGMEQLYRWADLFILPSIVEGSAMVAYEALGSGVPVIATPNAGTTVRHDVDGMIIPPRDPTAIADAIRRYHDDREILRSHSAATADRYCRESIGFSRYADQLASVVRSVAQ